MLHDAYRVQFAPAQARGDAVAVNMVWLVANTTVKGRADDDIEALRSALRGADDAAADCARCRFRRGSGTSSRSRRKRRW